MRSASARLPARFVIGLGANLGPKEQTLWRATELMAEHVEVLGRSDLYDTLAVGPPQPNYLNAAVLIETPFDAETLLGLLLDIESDLGRVRRERFGPRVLDLDLLWGAGIAVRSPRVTVPHPRLLERPFALLPLLDVAPNAVDPWTGATYARVRSSLAQGGILGRRPWLPQPFRPTPAR